jgi:hypothetical protein
MMHTPEAMLQLISPWIWRGTKKKSGRASVCSKLAAILKGPDKLSFPSKWRHRSQVPDQRYLPHVIKLFAQKVGFINLLRAQLLACETNNLIIQDLFGHLSSQIPAGKARRTFMGSGSAFNEILTMTSRNNTKQSGAYTATGRWIGATIWRV